MFGIGFVPHQISFKKVLVFVFFTHLLPADGVLLQAPHELLLTWTLRRCSEAELVIALGLLHKLAADLCSRYSDFGNAHGKRTPPIRAFFAQCGQFQCFASNLREIIFHMKDHKSHRTHCTRPYDRCWCVWHWNANNAHPTLVGFPGGDAPGQVPMWPHARLRRRLTKTRMMDCYFEINEIQARIAGMRCFISTFRRETKLSQFWLRRIRESPLSFSPRFAALAQVIYHCTKPYCAAEYIGQTCTAFRVR